MPWGDAISFGKGGARIRGQKGRSEQMVMTGQIQAQEVVNGEMTGHGSAQRARDLLSKLSGLSGGCRNTRDHLGMCWAIGW